MSLLNRCEIFDCQRNKYSLFLQKQKKKLFRNNNELKHVITEVRLHKNLVSFRKFMFLCYVTYVLLKNKVVVMLHGYNYVILILA